MRLDSPYGVHCDSLHTRHAWARDGINNSINLSGYYAVSGMDCSYLFEA